MRQQMKSPPDPGLGSDRPKGRGKTSTAQGEDQQEVPRMPHERDESADSQAQMEPSNRRMAEVAQRDVERGVADTTKGAELDATYDRLRKGARNPEKKFRP